VNRIGEVHFLGSPSANRYRKEGVLRFQTRLINNHQGGAVTTALELIEWMDRVFGEADPANYERLERLEGVCGPDEATLLRLSEVFENGSATLGRYGDVVVNQALWDLGVAVFRAFYDPAINWSVRSRFVKSFEARPHHYFRGLLKLHTRYRSR
jgi:hypothetical protein